MIIKPTILAAFLLSLVFLTPLMSTSTEIVVIPDTLSETLIDIHSPKLVITADIDLEMSLEILKLDLDTNTTETILGQPFSSELKISIDEPGFYIIQILSAQLGIITIEEEGIYTSYLLVVGILGLGTLIVGIQYLRKYIV